MKRYFLWVQFMYLCSVSYGQNTILTLPDYIATVQQFHPLSLQARLNSQKAFYTYRQALGNFDPKVEINKVEKIFDSKLYYNLVTSEIKVPLWYGIDLKGSYTTGRGDYLNPENKVPLEGLSSLALSIPLGKGLFLDERRAVLKQAVLFKKISAVEQQKMLNDLFLSAFHTYAEWLNAWLNTRVYTLAVKLAERRLEGIHFLYKAGDKPAVDTLDALTLLQTRQQKLIEFETILRNKKNELASNLWQENRRSINPDNLHIIPDSTLIHQLAPETLLNKESAEVIQHNLEIQQYKLKINQTEIERMMKLEDIKPTLTLNLGLLNSGLNVFNNASVEGLKNNQKIGFSIGIPITLTKQRAAYSLSQIKIKELEFLLLDKRNQTSLKWINYQNELINLDRQLSLLLTTQKNYRDLMVGEEIKFKLGESSLLLVNLREQKLLDSNEKINEVYIKRIKIIQTLKWLSNSL